LRAQRPNIPNDDPKRKKKEGKGKLEVAGKEGFKRNAQGLIISQKNKELSSVNEP